MKGKMELMEILILVVGITISLSLFYFSSQKLIFSRSKVMVETSKYEKLMDASRNLTSYQRKERMLFITVRGMGV